MSGPLAPLPYQSVSAADLAQLRANFSLDFSYSHLGKLHFSHSHKSGRTSYKVIYDGEWPRHLSAEATVVQRVIIDEKPVHLLCASIEANNIQLGNGTKVQEATAEWVRALRWLDQVGCAEDDNDHVPTTQAKPLSHDALAAMLEGQEYYFFTGAGLSAPVIPDWKGLMRLIGYDRACSLDQALSSLMPRLQHDLPVIMRSLHDAHCAFTHGRPTAGHRAIAAIAERLQRPVLTDNHDLIQQAAGTPTIHVNQLTPFQLSPWQPAYSLDAASIDGLVVCGMGGDRRGFLDWLRSNNPQVKIIHLDLKPAPNLNADYFIEGDLQVLLPPLMDRIAAHPVPSVQSRQVKRNLNPQP